MTVIMLCAKDGKRMIPVEGARNIYYRCPCFYRENRSDGEKPCNMRMSLIRSDMVKQDARNKYANGELKTGKMYICGHIAYRVARISEDYITIYVRRTQS